MICGYIAYENENREYARSNLLLMSKDIREEGFMSICYPCSMKLMIPSFSLHYIMAVGEYTEYTKDLTLVRECEERIRQIFDAFIENIHDGLAYTNITKIEIWPFYDWSDYSSGKPREVGDFYPDMCLNALLILALDSYEKLCLEAGLEFPYGGIAETLRRESYKTFFDSKVGAFSMLAGKEQYTELANSLAILAGVVKGAEAEQICQMMVDGKFVPCSLSNKISKYNALIMTNEESYFDVVLGEIRRDYKLMLDAGATSFWETIEGAAAFKDAGSLCHGWSAIPILYLNR
jgi:hypothetical protein